MYLLQTIIYKYNKSLHSTHKHDFIVLYSKLLLNTEYIKSPGAVESINAYYILYY